MATWVTGISIAPMTPISIDAALDGHITPTAINALKSEGYRELRIAELPISEQIKVAVLDCLKRTCRHGKDIDAVVIASETIGTHHPLGDPLDSARWFRNVVHQTLFFDCGLQNAQIFGAWMGACANVTLGMQLASSLIQSGTNAVLLISIDRMVAGARLQFNDTVPSSDCAVCCLLTGDSGEMEIQLIASRSASSLFQARKNLDKIKQSKQLIEEVSLLYNKAVSDAEFDVFKDDRLIIADNFRDLFYDVALMKFPGARRRLIRPVRDRWGHAFAGDNLIALANLIESGKVTDGQEVTVLNLGPVVMGLIALRFRLPVV